MWSELRDLKDDPPIYIVIQGDSYAPFGELDRFIAPRYVLLRHEGDWRLFRLSTASGALSPIEGRVQPQLVAD